MGSISKRIPKVGMRFRDAAEAWEFWVEYGGRIGFDVRKRNTIKSRCDGTITSCRFVCSNEGFRRKNQIDHEPKRIRAETRTDCKVRMIVSFDRVAKFFEVTEVHLEHNHLLQLPQTCHLLASQRKMFTPMLVEASQVYTPIIFEAFQGEYERSMAACCRVLDGNNKFAVAIASLHADLEFEEERIVIGDPLTKTVSCSCGMFNRTGILCGHGLKVLDLMNIKTLPTHYVLKRWTREARNGSIKDNEGRKVVENPKLEAQLRYRDLSHQFHNVAHRAASSLQCCLLLANALASVASSIEELLNAPTSAMDEPYKDKENVDPNVQQIDELLRAARLKKKEVPATKLRRKKTWLDKLLKGKRKPLKATTPIKKGENQKKKKDGMQQRKKDGVQKKKKDGVQQKKKDDVQPQVLVEKCDNNKGVNLEPRECNAIMSFTQLLTAPPCDNDDLF